MRSADEILETTDQRDEAPADFEKLDPVLIEEVKSGLASLLGGVTQAEEPTFETEAARKDDGTGGSQYTNYVVSWPTSVVPLGTAATVEVLATNPDGVVENITDLVNWRATPKHRFVIVEGNPTQLIAIAPGSVSLTARLGSELIGSIELTSVEAVDPIPPSIVGSWVDTTPDTQSLR